MGPYCTFYPGRGFVIKPPTAGWASDAPIDVPQMISDMVGNIYRLPRKAG